MKNDHQLAFYDVMPTFCDILGIENYTETYKRTQPNGAPDYFDGISFLPTLLGNDEAQQKHDYLYWELKAEDEKKVVRSNIGVRQGDWKLVSIDGICHLYDLATDIHEDNDLASDSRYQDKLEELKAIVLEAHVNSSDFPIILPQ